MARGAAVAAEATAALWLAFGAACAPRGGGESCSTVLLHEGEALLVAHNLDEGFEVPGQIVVNRRGVEKRNVSWEDLRIGGSGRVPRVTWVSRFASLTYNTLGREFIDGGLNEVGLYVGEMTLLGSRYPSAEALPKLYHHQWMQYLLDSFAGVPEVLASLDAVTLDGHCQWHFFVADREGRAATIEFEKGSALVRSGDRLPVPVLGNLPYDEEVKALKEYEGFGGAKPVAFSDRENGRRFVWGATMLRAFAGRPADKAVPYAFSILKQLDKGATRWSLVYDLGNLRLHWRTNRSPEVRHVDLAAFDFSCPGPAAGLDVHASAAGDVRARFAPLADADNRKAVEAALRQWDMGFMGNTFLKPRMAERLSAAAAGFHCPAGGAAAAPR